MKNARLDLRGNAMHVFSETLVIELLDGAAVCLLAAGASCRARIAGANIMGSVILGCLCGMLAPLMRESMLHGQPGIHLVLNALPVQAFTGACATLAALWMLGSRGRFLFFWIDSLGICLAAALFAALAMPELGLIGALVLSLSCALFPGLVRDVALGDVAMLAEQNWYGASAGLSAIITMAIIIAVVFFLPESSLMARLGEIAVLGGTALGTCIRGWKGREEIG